jgi:hypothetical protein
MDCTTLPHHQLRDYLEHTGPAGVFSRYVARKQGDGQSLAALHGAHVAGTAIAGRTFDLNEAYSHWVFADTPDAAAALAQALNGDDPAINFPLVYFDTFQALYPQRAISIDCLYLLPAARFRPATERYPVRKLSVEDLKDLVIPGELRPLLGSPEHWRDDMELYGVVDEGQLVCMAEATVRDRHIAVIQQLYTITSHRSRQLAQSLVGAMARRLIAGGMVPMYVADEANILSRNLAEKLGFKLDSRWGYIG